MIRIIQRRIIFDLPGFIAYDFKPPHRVRNRDHRDSIARSLVADGWSGRDLLAIDHGAGVRPRLLTGSHRYSAIIGIRGHEGALRIPVTLVTVNFDPAVRWSDDLANAAAGLLYKGGDNDDALARLIALERLSGVSLRRAIALMRRENREGR